MTRQLEQDIVNIGGHVIPTGEVRVIPNNSDLARALTKSDVELAFQCAFCVANLLHGGGAGPSVIKDGARCRIVCNPAIIYLAGDGNVKDLPCSQARKIRREQAE